MIVRIMGEGQFELDEDLRAALNALDDRLEVCFEHGDEHAFEQVRDEMLALVRDRAWPLEAARVAPSDVILPSSDATIDEVRHLLGEEGLVPG